MRESLRLVRRRLTCWLQGEARNRHERYVQQLTMGIKKVRYLSACAFMHLRSM